MLHFSFNSWQVGKHAPFFCQKILNSSFKCTSVAEVNFKLPSIYLSIFPDNNVRFDPAQCLMQYWVYSLSHQCYWLWPNDALKIIQVQDFSAFQKYCHYLIALACTRQRCLNLRSQNNWVITESNKMHQMIRQMQLQVKFIIAHFRYFLSIFFLLLGSPQSQDHLSSMGDRNWERCVSAY